MELMRLFLFTQLYGLNPILADPRAILADPRAILADPRAILADPRAIFTSS